MRGLSEIKLDPGKIITFTYTSRFLSFNKEKVPIIVTVEIEDNTGDTSKPEKTIKLESLEVQMP
jgi:hypothetical protein